MQTELSRRRLLAAGTALLLTGCAQRGAHEGRNDRNGGLWYLVVEGDTLSAVSRRSGISIQAIIDANNLSTPHLTSNTRLWIPGAVAIGPDPLSAQDAAELAGSEAPPATSSEDVDTHEKIAPPPVGGYVLVPRSAWTSQPLAGNNRLMGEVTRITLHHTGEHPGLAELPDVEVIRRIERYHRNERHWAAIGYHFIVGRDAKIYEGRPARFQGAHVLSENPNNLGISVIGDFQTKLPTQRQLSALWAFLDDERDKYRVGKSRTYGHRDLNKSICPGDALYGWLRGTYKGA